MMAINTRQFNRFYLASSSLVFILVLLRCAFVPFAHDEVATFNFYIQQGDFIPFLSHVDAMGHFLPTATAWICFKLFGSSTLALRLPCLLSFVLMGSAVFRINNLMSGTISKLVLTFSFLFSFNFLAFYSLCRGYGMSMALLLLAMYYFYCYARHLSRRHFVKFILFSQLALSANLTLVFVLLITTAILMGLQLRQKMLFRPRVLLAYGLHFALIAFWVKFAFFLQESGALYYGSGSSYWQVTFVTLIETIAFKNTAVTVVALLLFALMLLVFVRSLWQKKTEFLFNSYFSLSFVSLCGLIVSFWLLKKLFGINYPEDRTGLFFYLFFILSLGFMVSETEGKVRYAFLPLPLFFAIHFIVSVNLRVHPWRIYETIPTSFFKTLVAEQQNSKEPITIAGHRLREFIFGFLNYNSKTKLSHMTSPEALQMNGDYAVAYDLDKPYYDKYYTELAAENDWGFRLLKRRTPLQREVLYSTGAVPAFKGNYEYYNLFERLDTTFNSINPLLAEFEISVAKAPVPFNAWLVVQADNKQDGGESVFVRVPLNLINYDWNGTARFKTSLLTGNIPLNMRRIVCYLWNIDKKDIDLTVNSFRLCRLNGEGVTEQSKAKL